jgi:hypothetical protein
MGNSLIFAGLVTLVVCVFASRFLAVRAFRLLSPEEKVALVDACGSLQVFGALPLLVLFIGVSAVGFLPASFRWPAYLGGWALIAAYFAIMNRIVRTRLHKLGINSNYQKAQIKTRLMIYLGFFSFFALSTLSSFVTR